MDAHRRDTGGGGFTTRLTEAAFRMRAYRLKILLERWANFNPNQPRVPRGYRFGGRWTKPGGNWGPVTDADRPRIILASHEDEPPRIPEKRPVRARERNRIARAVARYLVNTSPIQQAIFLARPGWLINEAGHSIRSYFDPPRPLEELRRNASQSKPGYDIHHIVEKTPARQDGFPEWQIESSDNKVLIPRYRHWQITGWYGTKNVHFGGLSPRDYLRGKTWRERERVGHYALELFGAMKP